MGWMELLVVGVVALIVVGPKDLPVMFQALGKMTAKVRRMAREFSSAMQEAANATGAADISKDLKGLTSPRSLGIDKLKDAADSFDKWEPGKSASAMGSETAKLAQKRAEDSRKMQKKTAELKEARLNKEAAAKSEAAAPAKKPRAKKPAAKKPAAKSAAKPAAKKPAAKKPATKKAAAKKPAAKKAPAKGSAT